MCYNYPRLLNFKKHGLGVSNSSTIFPSYHYDFKIYIFYFTCTYICLSACMYIVHVQELVEVRRGIGSLKLEFR